MLISFLLPFLQVPEDGSGEGERKSKTIRKEVKGL